MRRVLIALVVVCIAGCPAPTNTDTDAPVIDNDGPPPGAARLTIAWITDLGPSFPTEAIANLDVEDVRFRMENLHAEVNISPGDPRTTEDEVQLHWDDSNTPGTVVFGDAPAGVYANVVLKLDEGDQENAFEIEGKVEIGGSDVDFQIDDIDSLSVSMPIGPTALDLSPGAEATLLIEIEVRDAIAAVDYDVLPDDGGRRLLQKGDPQMAAFRNALRFSATVLPGN
jgi:hypothetical protein